MRPDFEKTEVVSKISQNGIFAVWACFVLDIKIFGEDL